MGSGGKWLISEGLTNYDAPSFSELVSADKSKSAVGSCKSCGTFTRNQDHTKCPNCGYALFWKRLSALQIEKLKANSHLRKEIAEEDE